MLQIKNTLGGGKPEGLYAWKKYGVSEVEYLDIEPMEKYVFESTATNRTVSYKNGNGYAYDETTKTFSLTGSVYDYSIDYNIGDILIQRNTYILISGHEDILIKTNDGAYNRTYVSNGANGLSVYTSDTSLLITVYANKIKPSYNFLDYIVSDKESAYPDGAVQDGYYYERVVEGLDLSALGMTKYETGSFTLSSDNYTVTFNHTLGEKPKAVIVNEDSSITDLNYVNTYLAPSSYGAYVYSNRVSGNSASGNTLNESTVTVNTGNTTRKFKAGVKYNYVVFA